MKPLLIAVMGSTASGKTDFAEALATEVDAQLINADNFCCYRHLDIGTAKPADRSRYALLDILDPSEPFGVGAWVRRAGDVLLGRSKTSLAEEGHLRPQGEIGGPVGFGAIPPASVPSPVVTGKNFVIVGGSGLNIRALFNGYEGMSGPPPEGLREALNAREMSDLVAELQSRDPIGAAKIDLQNPVRVKRALERLDAEPGEDGPDLSGFRKFKIGLEVPVDWVNERIERRVEAMVEAGWLEEVAHIRELGFAYDDPGLKAHGYRNLWDVLDGRKALGYAKQEIVTMVRQYAKRQRTWMRSERNLCKISAEDGQRAVSDALLLFLGE